LNANRALNLPPVMPDWAVCSGAARRSGLRACGPPGRAVLVLARKMLVWTTGSPRLILCGRGPAATS
jgi:hypothetical protein